MDEKRKPYVTISFRQPRLSGAIIAIILFLGMIAGAFGFQEVQRWQNKLLDSEARLHETEGKLTETTNRLHETEGELTETTSRLHETEGKLTETASRLHETETRLQETKTELRVTENSLAETTTRLQETETSRAETETRLQEVEAELLEAKEQLEAYLPISPLHEPIAFISDKWGVSALACIRMPQGYWTGWGSEDGIGRLLYYSARKWDSVESINLSGKYKFVGEEEWSANWDEEEGFESRSYYTHVAVRESHPFTWSKSKDWISNVESWEGRLNDYCRNALQQ